MLGRLINGILITPSENEKKKIVITNPSKEILKAVMGYKDLIIEDKPEYDEETQYLNEAYTETDTQITVHWEVKDLSELTEGE